ncbi:MAG: hypothetical protein ABSA44_05000 [Bacteroidota bacterium]|jgi:hypothetical protein
MKSRIFNLLIIAILSILICDGKIKKEPSLPKDTLSSYLGVLERDKSNSHLRILFHYFHGKWVLLHINDISGLPIKKTIVPTSWSVVYKNRVVGKVVTKGPHAIRYYDELNLFDLESSIDTIQAGRQLSKIYSGWKNELRRRPLPAISNKIKFDVCTWDTIKLSEKEHKNLIYYYRKIVGDTIRICSLNEPINNSLIHYAYSDDDIMVGSSYIIQGRIKLHHSN